MATAEPIPSPGASRSGRERASRLPCGDPARLGELLRGVEPRLTAVALRFTRDADAARDVVQNAFEKVLRHCEQFRGDAKLSTWLHRIVANEAMMWLRAERRAARTVRFTDPDQLEVVEPAPGAAEQLETRRRREWLRAGMTRLRRAERDVVVHCALGEQSYAQFGAETGVHPAAVKTRAFRARRRLGEILRDL